MAGRPSQHLEERNADVGGWTESGGKITSNRVAGIGLRREFEESVGSRLLTTDTEAEMNGYGRFVVVGLEMDGGEGAREEEKGHLVRSS